MALVDVICRQLAQHVADQEDRLVRDAIGQFLGAARDFEVFEEAQGPADVGDLAAAALAEDFDLLRRETKVPQRSPFTLVLEAIVKFLQARRIAETAKV